MSKLITRTAFVEKLQRRGYKVVSTFKSVFDGVPERVEVYKRPQGTREYWVANRFCHRIIVNRTSMKWDGFLVYFKPEKGGEV